MKKYSIKEVIILPKYFYYLTCSKNFKNWINNISKKVLNLELVQVYFQIILIFFHYNSNNI